MTNSREYAIEVEGLTKRYGALWAINGVSFTVQRGEVFAFLGANGAGKTTTAEIIETLRAPTSGQVNVLGMDVTTRKRDIVPRIGVLPQGFSSFDLITVRESIKYFASLYGCDDAVIDRMIDLANLRDTSDVQFRRLSGGMKQRLGIALALVNDPEVVFLDEPTTGLDPQARRAVWDVLRGLRSKGTTVFLTTHSMEEAECLADTVAIISHGTIIASGSPDELINRYAGSLWLTLKPDNAEDHEAITRLNLAPFESIPQGIHIRLKRTEDVVAILASITQAGIALPHVEVRSSHLEEVFLSLTNNSLRAGAAASGDMT